MTYKLNDKQFESIVQLADHERYDYFLKKVTEWEEIWSLYSPEGWVELSSSDGEECLPIWPHPDFAGAWAVADWSDCQPKAINLEVWLERWTPGLERDNTMLAVFPVNEEEGLVVTPSELQEAILGELQQG
ncbi:DUF2750 domain-containing protein [Endozoicomonas sp. ONNA2]|uniref:DUF2750 domain-containing protein n=1 Tax=Endozoicomonas sp. ONNA2 TaxID=2828741 RepID=UPI002147A525|nr:DUF2750 domain-containing protein [Endozoicomonas sp. ONNA2]